MTHSEQDARPSSGGFSLIELLVVMGIIGVAAAISLPAIGRYIRNYRIRGATQQVAGEIQAARNRAITKNVNLGVVFLTLSPTTYQWAVEDDQTGMGSAGRSSARPTINATFLADKAQASPVFTLPQGITFGTATSDCPTPPSGGAFDTGMRFNRMGQWCDPGTSTTTCPTLGFGQASVYNIAPSSGATGSSMICVTQTSSGLKRFVTVEQGGRVQAQQ